MSQKSSVHFTPSNVPRLLTAAIERQGFPVVPLPVDEIGRIDAGLSCMSLWWRSSGGNQH